MLSICFVNHKGGVGKTSTALAVAEGLNRSGKDTLFIDLDPQGNATYTLDVITKENKNSLVSASQLFTDEPLDLNNIIVKRSLYVIPSNQYLAVTEKDIKDLTAMKEKLNSLSDKVEYVIIDTPPALNNLTLTALMCCDYLITPTHLEGYSLKGLEQLKDTLDAVKEKGSHIEYLGILFSMYEKRLTLSKLIERNFRKFAENAKTSIFNTRIRKAQIVTECNTARNSIFEYAPLSDVTKDYENLIIEILDKITQSQDKF